MKVSALCGLFLLITFIFTASQTAEEKELIAITHASMFEALGALQLDLDGVLPSLDELAEVLSDPAAALASVVERIANLSSYAELDPAYLAEGVGLLAAINLVLSFVKLLATYGRKLFALVDAAKAITGHGAGSEGDDGTVQVYETMTNLEAVAILDLLNKPAVQAKFGHGVSFGELVLKEELREAEEMLQAKEIQVAALKAMKKQEEQTKLLARTTSWVR